MCLSSILILLVSMLQFMEICLAKFRAGRLIEQYVKLFPTGCFVMIHYVFRDFFEKTIDHVFNRTGTVNRAMRVIGSD